MGGILRSADLVVSRSGINTVSELMALGCVALLIPLQVGKLREQEENARFFKKVGLGEYVLQGDVTSKLLFDQITTMIKNHTKYIQNRKRALKYVTLDAVENIITVINNTYEGRRDRRTA